MRSFIVAAAITTTLLFSQGHAKSAEIKILSVVPLKTSLDELGPSSNAPPVISSSLSTTAPAS